MRFNEEYCHSVEFHHINQDTTAATRGNAHAIHHSLDRDTRPDSEKNGVHSKRYLSGIWQG